MDDIPAKKSEDDERSEFEPEGMALAIELQPSVVTGIDGLFDRYIEVMGNTEVNHEDWLDRDEFLIFALDVGLGYPKMKLSDIINQAIVKGGLEIAENLSELERQAGIT